jgi:hypothetical protein
MRLSGVSGANFTPIPQNPQILFARGPRPSRKGITMKCILFAHIGGGAFALLLIAALLVITVCFLGKDLQK